MWTLITVTNGTTVNKKVVWTPCYTERPTHQQSSINYVLRIAFCYWCFLNFQFKPLNFCYCQRNPFVLLRE
ncbi:hypothetical protein HanXRQr2_Chr02g0048501 [Helianthus annuus]|uniref:Uncharacterized protein n=1 Tax=Helianthus annuus TaxID=4232 RepID=A0A9K3JM91_HELAN|nr:hypothetical protein HanXRQr2_Chr02g0048501 [Helianthus annuus]KAJ0950410.1 hypothetical protein HanPSC8_Chr02g0047991 [Helianthus annuus]